MRDQPSYNRRSMLIATTSTFALFAMGVDQSAFAQSMSPMIKSVVDAYIYFYPLVVFGVSFEVLTNVEKPTWERLSAPVNQFMSVRQNRPDNHGVILPSTDTLYTMAWVDVAKEPVVFYAPEIPDIPGRVPPCGGCRCGRRSWRPSPPPTSTTGRPADTRGFRRDGRSRRLAHPQ